MDVQGGHRIEYDSRPVCAGIYLPRPSGRQAETPDVSFSVASVHSNIERAAGLKLPAQARRLDRLPGQELGLGERRPMRCRGLAFDVSVAHTNARPPTLRTATCPVTPNRAFEGKVQPLEQPRRLGLLLACLSLGC